MPRTHMRPPDWVRTPDDGLYALLIAAVDLARHDAQLDPPPTIRPDLRRELLRQRASARAFLLDWGALPAVSGDD